MNDGPPSISNQGEQTPFFPVSRLKLVVMATVTFGIYEIYWFFQNWKLVKQRSGQEIQPFWRALFAFFFCYSLFKEVKESAASRQVSSSFPPGLLTAAWIGLTACWRLPDPYWMIDGFAVLALLPVQKVMNDLNARVTPNHETNGRFSGWNIAVIILGGLVFCLAIVGTFFPELVE